jgi:hypothetical protein
MSDLLSASSMFLAVISLLYSSWYPEISSNIKIEGKTDFKADNKEIIKKVKNTLLFRALPLSASSFLLFCILLPDFIKIIGASINRFYSPKYSFATDYDAVKTLFCIIVLSTAILFIHLFIQTLNLRKNYIKLNT